MKLKILSLSLFVLSSTIFADGVKIPRNASEDVNGVMEKAYWDIWNEDVQKKIDADIEKNRKADACINVGQVAENSRVSVNQISHDFKFGAHIFNYNQLGDKVLNAKYKSLYGTLFNSATVPFYWSKFERIQNQPRHKTEYVDTQEFWQNCPNPKEQIYWRRPPTDEIIDYCISRDVRVHGHAIVWGNRGFGVPVWLFDSCMSGEEKTRYNQIVSRGMVEGVKNIREQYTKEYEKMSCKELEEKFPNFAKSLMKAFEDRIEYFASYYGDKIESWDLVNESLEEYADGFMNKDGLFCKCTRYGIMPADYTYKSFQKAQKCFPKNVKLNINENPYGPHRMDKYDDQVNDLIERGCKVDIVGWQMHIFLPKVCSDIAKGVPSDNPYYALHYKKLLPTQIWEDFKVMESTNRPIHMSEITISAPDNTHKGKMIQAVITRNLYRMWFSQKSAMGITWWNVVDDCGVVNEPTTSGLFSRTMEPKPAFYALNELINSEWKTNLELSPDAEGNIKFRGFKGRYRLSWKDVNGNEHFRYVNVN